jgi:N-acetylmuramic acid 6-phosphate etherase
MKDISEKARQEAENFLQHEKQFHLGILPTEQSNPKTRYIDRIFKKDPANGVATLLSVDRDIQAMARRVLKSDAFRKMVHDGTETVAGGGRIVFSGCGSTGRLSIQLEAMWRCFFRNTGQDLPDLYARIQEKEDQVFSIMTGGDYAMIRSVEYFEDYLEFGRQQVREMDLSEKDMLVAITEGGETSSVLGTVEEAADRGAGVFLLFNNPAAILVEHIERSRRAIEDPRVTVLELYCGPMAIAGSTRMQATSAGLLIAGAALEMILARSIEPLITPDQRERLPVHDTDHAEAFCTLLNELSSAGNRAELANLINLETETYQQKGLVTYFADEFLLDIFTDTTERAPTFKLPPFRKSDDAVSPVSWAFVKSPLRKTDAVWEYILGRTPRCLEWDPPLYRQMGVPENLAAAPPKLDREEILKFLIGNEDDPSRWSRRPSIAISIIGRRETLTYGYESYLDALKKHTPNFDKRHFLIIGRTDAAGDYRIDVDPAPSLLHGMEHLAVKLILNTISTGTMVLSGRVTGNWMSWVEVTNKKLRDRGIRLIAEICGLPYRDACYALHETMVRFREENTSGMERPSPVQYTIAKYQKRNGNTD